MRRRVGLVALCIASVALGAVLQRFYDTSPSGGLRPVATESPSGGEPGTAVRVDFAGEPLWAYGFLEPPAPGEKAAPQAPPSRKLRPNEDATEQTRGRQVPGSPANYSLVDVRDGQNVIDWFPNDHPPMPNLI